ncbi:uncharacterized protein (UPF0548 family) [Arthrobacter sp. CAN_A214]|uniref:DUF1990 family protein n=1 Tax=Arthrobacter sp. CAN_A214 TaxID=2787720 RepID=UPI0018CB8F34
MRQFTYPDVGATDRPYPERLDGGWPEGYRRMVESHGIEAADPAAAFLALVDGILSWELHRGAGLTMAPDAPRAAPGGEVVSGFGIGRARIPAPCRVVWAREALLDGGGRAVPGQRAGFGYGTLKGHPVRGEEGFHAELTAGGKLIFTCSAYSVPANLLYAIGSPVTRLTQRYVLSRYGEAARKLAAR